MTKILPIEYLAQKISFSAGGMEVLEAPPDLASGWRSWKRYSLRADVADRVMWKGRWQ